MAARVSGHKVVSAAVAGTVLAVAVGTVYLPFVADRDKMRGMHEEQTPPTSAMLAQEIKKLQRDGILKGDDGQDDEASPPKGERKSLAPGSMWKQFR
jgi:hypothetical protein